MATTLKFNAIDNLISNIKKLNSDSILKKVLADSKLQQDILDLNRLGQLYNEGVDSDGKFLGNYTSYSIDRKLDGDGDHRIDHITLKDTGEFYDSFKFKNNVDSFVIKADTIKPDQDLAYVYGAKILGLNAKSLSILRSEILPPVRTMVLAQIRK